MATNSVRDNRYAFSLFRVFVMAAAPRKKTRNTASIMRVRREYKVGRMLFSFSPSSFSTPYPSPPSRETRTSAAFQTFFPTGCGEARRAIGDRGSWRSEGVPLYNTGCERRCSWRRLWASRIIASQAYFSVKRRNGGRNVKSEKGLHPSIHDIIPSNNFYDYDSSTACILSKSISWAPKLRRE